MEYEVTDEIWKQTGMSIQIARKSGIFEPQGFKDRVSAFDPKSREEYREITAAVKAEWESV